MFKTALATAALLTANGVTAGDRFDFFENSCALLFAAEGGQDVLSEETQLQLDTLILTLGTIMPEDAMGHISDNIIERCEATPTKELGALLRELVAETYQK